MRPWIVRACKMFDLIVLLDLRGPAQQRGRCRWGRGRERGWRGGRWHHQCRVGQQRGWGRRAWRPAELQQTAAAGMGRLHPDLLKHARHPKHTRIHTQTLSQSHPSANRDAHVPLPAPTYRAMRTTAKRGTKRNTYTMYVQYRREYIRCLSWQVLQLLFHRPRLPDRHLIVVVFCVV